MNFMLQVITEVYDRYNLVYWRQTLCNVRDSRVYLSVHYSSRLCVMYVIVECIECTLQ